MDALEVGSGRLTGDGSGLTAFFLMRHHWIVSSPQGSPGNCRLYEQHWRRPFRMVFVWLQETLLRNARPIHWATQEPTLERLLLVWSVSYASTFTSLCFMCFIFKDKNLDWSTHKKSRVQPAQQEANVSEQRLELLGDWLVTTLQCRIKFVASFNRCYCEMFNEQWNDTNYHETEHSKLDRRLNSNTYNQNQIFQWHG